MSPLNEAAVVTPLIETVVENKSSLLSKDNVMRLPSLAYWLLPALSEEMVTLLKVGCVLSKLTFSPSVSLLIVVRSVPALPALSVKEITKAAVENDLSDAEQLSNLSINGKTVEEIRTQLIGKIGENITIRRVEKIIAKDNLFSYNHGGRVGVIVDIKSSDEVLGKDIAMHIAATKPKALDQSGVSQDLIDAERRVAIEKAKEAGKPEEMLEKIATGTVNKFLKEITLVNQVFVKDEKQTIEQLLKNNNSAINGFKFFIVGEGIEKKEVDFASEVAAAQQ